MKKQQLLNVPNFFDLVDESTGMLSIADIAAKYKGVDEEALFTATSPLTANSTAIDSTLPDVSTKTAVTTMEDISTLDDICLY